MTGLGDGKPEAPQDAVADDRRRRGLFIAAWAGFALLVLVLAGLSLRACALSWLPWLGSRCETAIVSAPAPQSAELANEVRRLERQLAQAGACKPDEHAQAEPVNCPTPPPDEVVVTVDVSNSMSYCLNASQQLEREMLQLDQRSRQPMTIWQQYEHNNRVNAITRALTCQPPARRLDYAKKALSAFAGSARSEATYVLQSFSSCGAGPTTHGRYAGGERSRMVDQANALRLGANTALAEALRGAAAQLQGGKTPDQPANIVVISDGQDNCGGDPCATARAIKQSHPYVRIHVITVGGDVNVGQCIASATGGKVFEARDASRLAEAIEEASGENIPPECKRPGATR